jgi:hypothetical protein
MSRTCTRGWSRNACGREGAIAIVVRHPRPKPEAIDKITDQQRVDLFRTMTAYGETYRFDENTVEHSIDIKWNEVWSGTKQVRTVPFHEKPLASLHRRAGFLGGARLHLPPLHVMHD